MTLARANDAGRRATLPRPTPAQRAVPPDAGALTFRSTAYMAALAQVARFARDDRAAIVLEGESGTGKTQLAKTIHAASARARGPYHHIVLSTLDDSLASSELFGHVAGAFTDARSSRSGHFVSANGGTLFLDEIGKASLAVQQKLLHAIEYGEIRPVGSDRDIRVDARLVAATSIPLAQLVNEGRFLADLHARLTAFRVHLPALRDRRPDIPILVSHYVAVHSASCHYPQPPGVEKALMDALQAADWPHNLRQLSSTIHRLLVDAEGAPVLTLAHCADDLAYLRGATGSRRPTLSSTAVADAIARVGTIAGAARLLGVDRTTIYRVKRGDRATGVQAEEATPDRIDQRPD